MGTERRLLRLSGVEVCQCLPSGGAALSLEPALCCSDPTLGPGICPSGTTCAPGMGGIQLCLSPGLQCLGPTSGTTSPADALARCFTPPRGEPQPFWARGDCDEDGITNGEESRSMGDPCCNEAETPIGCCTGGGATLEECCAMLPGDPACCSLASNPVSCCIASGGSLGECCPADADPASCCMGAGESPVTCCAGELDPLACCIELSSVGPMCCGAFGAGRPECADDGGAADPDAGVVDGGANVDGGGANVDAGGARDGGPALEGDAGGTPDGSSERDAGPAERDAGSGAMDGGADPAEPGVSFGGGGGCRCSAGRRGPPSLLALLGLALLARARRR